MKNICTLLILVIFSAYSIAAESAALSSAKVQQIERLVGNKFPASGAGAAVMVVKDDQVIFDKAFGQAVIEHHVPMRTNTPFKLGSITKQFTAVAILMLQEAGKLSIDDNIAKYLPEYKPTKNYTITIKQLLSHTAGVPNYDGNNGYSHHGTDEDDFETLLGAFNNLPLEFEPGSKVNYSNSGYILLGRVIEKLSQMTYPEFIEQHIFKKLDMQSSGFYDYYTVVPRLAKGYEIDDKPPHNIVHGKAVKPSLLGDGGIISTFADLTKWYEALDKNLLISKESLSLAHSAVYLDDGRDTKTGLGWKVANLGTHKTVEHGGNNHSFENYILQLPQEKLIVMVFTNLNRSYPGSLAEKIAAIVTNMPMTDKKQITLKQNELEQFAGRYQYEDGDIRSIHREGGILVSVRKGGNKARLIPFDNNKFYFADAPVYWLRFEKDSQSGRNIMYSESRVSTYIMAKQVL